MEQWTDAHGANAVKRPNRRVRDPYARAVWEGNPDSLRVGATYPIGRGRGRISLLREWAAAGCKPGICSKYGKKIKDMNKTP